MCPFWKPVQDNNPYLPALMIRWEVTYLVHILLMFIKTTLHDKFKGVLQQASAKQTEPFN